MIKKTLSILCIIMLAPFVVFGQNEANDEPEQTSEITPKKIRIGLSGRISNFYLVDNYNSTISIPIFINSKIKIEPELSYLSEKIQDSTNSAAFNDQASLHIGAGISFLKPFQYGYFNIGIRAGITKTWIDSEVLGGSSYYVGPVIGYDHFLSKNFALGLDINPYFLKQNHKNIFKTNTAIKVSMVF
ncbi:MAG: hypothetical protein PHY85_04175 [Bacteroidales bacterium]|nr:hypothetical protein [Bacteroidales bacterium]